MPTVIDRQIQAFRESVERFDHEAVIAVSNEACVVLDLLAAGIAVAQQWHDHINLRLEHGSVPPEYWSSIVPAAKASLELLLAVKKIAITFKSGEIRERFDDAILGMRRNLAWLDDLQLPRDVRERNEKIIAGLDYEKLVHEPRGNSPPQRWFDEDMTGLRGD